MNIYQGNILFVICVLLCFFSNTLFATILHVDNQNIKASDTNEGSQLKPFKTIQKAVELAYAGDTVLIHEGVYREYVHPVRSGKSAEKMILIKGEEGKRVVISGAEKWNADFEQITLDGSKQVAWKGSLKPEFFQSNYPMPHYNPFHIEAMSVFNLGYSKGGSLEKRYKKARPIKKSSTQIPQVLGMVIYKNKPLRQCFDKQDILRSTGNYFVSEDGKLIFFRLPGDASPKVGEMQLAVREQVLAPRISGLRFIHLQGLIFEYAANGIPYPVNGMVSTSSGRYWLIEDCTFQYANTIGLDFGMGHWITRIDKPWPKTVNLKEQYDLDAKLDFDFIVRNNQFLYNGTNGIFSYMGVSYKRDEYEAYPFANALIEGNVVQSNNWQGMYRWKEAGIKLLAGEGIVIRGNNISGNNAIGIWLDVCYGNIRVTQNIIANNVMAGIFCEAIPGPTLIDNNIIMNTTSHYTNAPKADGIYQHQCPNITVAHNLLANNANSGVKMILHSKGALGTFHKENASVSYNHIANNLIQENGAFAAGLPLETELSKGNTFKGNLCWGSESIPLYEISRSIAKPAELVEKITTLLESNPNFEEPVFWDLWKSESYGYRYPGATLVGPRVRLNVFESYFDSQRKNWNAPIQMCALGNDYWLKLNVNKDYYRRGKKIALEYAELIDYEVDLIPNIKYDYFGNKRDVAKTIPGPFSKISDIGIGEKRWVDIQLWPNRKILEIPALSMKLQEKLPPKNLNLPKAPWSK